MKFSNSFKTNFVFFFAHQLTYLCSSLSFVSSTLACAALPHVLQGRISTPVEGAISPLLGFGGCSLTRSHRLQSIQSCSSHFRMRIPCDSSDSSPKVSLLYRPTSLSPNNFMPRSLLLLYQPSLICRVLLIYLKKHRRQILVVVRTSSPNVTCRQQRYCEEHPDCTRA
jgi:hypothetical protein